MTDRLWAMPFRPALPMNRAVFHRLGLTVGIAIAVLSTVADARGGCWRPNGWCTREARERREEQQRCDELASLAREIANLRRHRHATLADKVRDHANLREATEYAKYLQEQRNWATPTYRACPMPQSERTGA